MKSVVRLSKKCNLGNYSDDHKFETFEISLETEIEGALTDDSMKAVFDDLRARLFDQEHDTILHFLENSHEEKEPQNPNEHENGELKL